MTKLQRVRHFATLHWVTAWRVLVVVLLCAIYWKTDEAARHASTAIYAAEEARFEAEKATDKAEEARKEASQAAYYILRITR